VRTGDPPTAAREHECDRPSGRLDPSQLPKVVPQRAGDLRHEGLRAGLEAGRHE
jgi:hypothetical protein